jgi:hypothetical protein
MNCTIKSPLEASKSTCEKDDFFTAYPLREWALVKRIIQIAKDDICGELCSLRFTWQKPKKNADSEEVFFFNTLAGLIDVAWIIADSPLKVLHIERVPNKNNLFALAMFENEVVAELELNECLPDSMPATHFIKANFQNGHVTNQPVVGHFNEEGAMLATDSEMRRIVIENSEWCDCGDEIELCQRAMEYAILKGKFPSGRLNSLEIITAIRCAFEYGTYSAEKMKKSEVLNLIRKAV